MRKIISHIVNSEQGVHQFTMHIDPGHAWLEIPRSLYNNLQHTTGLQVSQFSRMSERAVYAEEDCDMPLVLEALDKANINYEINEFIHSSTNNNIRNYVSYKSYGYPG